MDSLFLIIAIVGVLSFIAFGILSAISFVGKNKPTGIKRLKFSGISFAVMLVSFIMFGVTTDTSEVSADKDIEEAKTEEKAKSEETAEEKAALEAKEAEEKAAAEAKAKEEAEAKAKAEAEEKAKAEAAKSPQQKMFEKVSELIASGQAFDTGSYIQGDIPEGEYVFVTFEGSGTYYSEDDPSGNIIDNENFDSFGYVHVHAAGNLTTQGALIPVGALETLQVSGAKQLYETMNNKEGYLDAGYYKVGVDIPAGQYNLESYGDAYVAIMSGPVGTGDIVDNELFNGKYSVTVRDGQYLHLTRAKIIQ